MRIVSNLNSEFYCGKQGKSRKIGRKRANWEENGKLAGSLPCGREGLATALAVGVSYHRAGCMSVCREYVHVSPSISILSVFLDSFGLWCLSVCVLVVCLICLFDLLFDLLFVRLLVGWYICYSLSACWCVYLFVCLFVCLSV